MKDAIESSNDSTHAERRRRRLASIVEEALRISDGYQPEPILATTGEGSLKSKGVAGLLEDEIYLQQRAIKRRSDGGAP